jgi:hypothetical protein
MVGTAAELPVRGRDVRIGRPGQDFLRRRDVPRQLGMGGPQQGDNAGDVRSRHRGAAQRAVRGVVRPSRGASTRSRRDDVWLDAVRPVNRDRAAATEVRHDIGAGGQSACRKGSRVDRRRILDGAAVRPGVPSGSLDKDAARLCVLDDRPQRVCCAAFARTAAPAVVHHMRPPRRVRVLAGEVGRSDEELEALGVARRSAGPLIHVPAPDPLGTGGDADLVAHAVVSRGRPGRVGAVAVVVAGLLVIRST